jgi:16S rRNA G527 N7-methylase RsmG
MEWKLDALPAGLTAPPHNVVGVGSGNGGLPGIFLTLVDISER